MSYNPTEPELVWVETLKPSQLASNKSHNKSNYSNYPIIVIAHTTLLGNLLVIINPPLTGSGLVDLLDSFNYRLLHS